EELQRVPSPSGELEAMVFLRSCGAPTPLSTQVSVYRTGESPRGEGNVFQAQPPPEVPATPIEVRATWEGDGRRSIRYDGSAVVRWAVAVWGDLAVNYETHE